MAAAQAVIREIEIDPFAILPHDMEIYGIFEYKSTVPHVGTSSGFTVAACCSYPPVIQSSQQARQSERTVRLERKMWLRCALDQSVTPVLDRFHHLTQTHTAQISKGL